MLLQILGTQLAYKVLERGSTSMELAVEAVAPCPNCGRRMVLQEPVPQSAAGRDVLLQWARCVACRHVRLERWSIAGAKPSAPRGRGHSRS